MSKQGPFFVRENHYSTDIGVVNKEAEYIRDATFKDMVYHICKRTEIAGQEDFIVGKLNYNPFKRKYYCENCHTWKPIKDFQKEKDGTGTEGHA